MPRRDEKPGAMFLFAPESAQGKNREGGPGRNFRQEIDVGRIPPLPKIKTSHKRGVLFLVGGVTGTASCHVGIRKPEPYASLSLCEAETKGEHGEAGPRAARVNEPTCGQIPPLPKNFLTKKPYFVVAHLLEYLGATAPLRTVYFASSRLELELFILKIFPTFSVRELTRRDGCRLSLKVRKAKTARAGPGKSPQSLAGVSISFAEGRIIPIGIYPSAI